MYEKEEENMQVKIDMEEEVKREINTNRKK